MARKRREVEVEITGVSSKHYGDMSLKELREYMKVQSALLEQDALFDKNKEWAKRWIDIPLPEFEEQWIKCKRSALNISQAYRDFYRLAGAYREQEGADAIVIPDGYNGPLLADVVGWRFRELELVNFAKQKDAERSAAASGVPF